MRTECRPRGTVVPGGPLMYVSVTDVPQAEAIKTVQAAARPGFATALVG